MLDVIATGVQDVYGRKIGKPLLSFILVVCAFLISLMYCTRFGYYLLDGVDRWINNLALVFVVWSEMSLSTTVYRYTDVLGQTGKPAYFLWNAGYFGGQILGVAIGHATSAPIGAGVGFGVFIAGTGAALLLAKTPDAEVPGFWNKNAFLRRFWFLAFYSVRPLSPLPHKSSISR